MTEGKASMAWSMNGEDWKKVGKGFVIAIVGAGALAAADQLVNISDAIDFDQYEAISVAVVTTIANAIRKWVSGLSK